MTENTTTYVVNGLELDTEYVFSIKAFNELGSSKYLPTSVKAKTSSKSILFYLLRLTVYSKLY